MYYLKSVFCLIFTDAVYTFLQPLLARLRMYHLNNYSFIFCFDKNIDLELKLYYIIHRSVHELRNGPGVQDVYIFGTIVICHITLLSKRTKSSFVFHFPQKVIVV